MSTKEIHATNNHNGLRGKSQSEATGSRDTNNFGVSSQVSINIPPINRGKDATPSNESVDTNVSSTGKQDKGTL